jgi:hypothetical protein
MYVRKKYHIFTLLAIFLYHFDMLRGNQGVSSQDYFRFADLNIPGIKSFSLQDFYTATCKKHLMVIFIHGTRLPYPSLEGFFHSMKTFWGQGKQSWYQYYLEALRSKGLFSYQSSSNRGLHEIEQERACEHGHSSISFIAADIFKHLFQDMTPDKYEKFSFYNFGWDGKLDKKNRKDSARLLYNELAQELTKQSLRDGIAPYQREIMICAHSHGGNVALNLASIHDTKKQQIHIDRLVLLGTPVQSETEKYINAPIFEKIYNIYSKGDTIQILDMISTRDYLSRRRFSCSKKNTEALKKVVQVEVKAGRHDPSHGELWLFCGKKNTVYRKKLAINPLPVFAFVPLICTAIESAMPNAQDIRLSIQKDEDNFWFNFSSKQQQSISRPVLLEHRAALNHYPLHDYMNRIIRT